MIRFLTGKTIVVTGSSSGIGRSIAIECARHGARLVLHHIGDAQSSVDVQTLKEELEELYGPDVPLPRVTEIAADVTDPAAGKRIIDTALSSFGEINGVVHNAGMCQFADFDRVTQVQVKRHMDVNYGGPFMITQAIVQQMIHQGKGGSIVCIASVTATNGSSRLAHYAATKAAVLGMTVSCAIEQGKHRIRFNCVSPGTVETEMNRKDLEGPKKAAMEDRVPLGRLGVPEDISKPVVFFLSDMAQYVSGQNLVVDGGASLYYQ